MRRFLPTLFGLYLCSATLAAGLARADQPRDFMLGVDDETEGFYGTFDFFGTGLQLHLDHRLPIYHDANNLKNRVMLRASYPLGELSYHTDLRVLVFNIGASAGVRTIWRNLSFAPGEPVDRGARRDRDEFLAGETGTDTFGFVEGRLGTLVPFNKWFVLRSSVALRWEGRKDRSFDWLYTQVHDGGRMVAWETMAFVKHRDWGGIGPYLQVLWFERDGEKLRHVAPGLTATTRVGLFRRDDLVFLNFAIRPGDDVYGQHSYYAPVNALLVYRVILDL